MSARVMIPELARLCGHEDLGELSVLDVGCGVKFSQVLMNDGLPVGRYVGVDVYRPMIYFCATTSATSASTSTTSTSVTSATTRRAPR